eukprot:TRINITY_DN5811_c0_g1_i16.p1 TRINITY_DN5811_c0_g1~~TRINITY_DN5811_c0_g1_i16.p1  ORF type:complete len:652 (-),score=155.81 TRINITY_DN5811_c0_g1_i16:45-2000(-)
MTFASRVLLWQVSVCFAVSTSSSSDKIGLHENAGGLHHRDFAAEATAKPPAGAPKAKAAASPELPSGTLKPRATHKEKGPTAAAHVPTEQTTTPHPKAAMKTTTAQPKKTTTPPPKKGHALHQQVESNADYDFDYVSSTKENCKGKGKGESNTKGKGKGKGKGEGKGKGHTLHEQAHEWRHQVRSVVDQMELNRLKKMKVRSVVDQMELNRLKKMKVRSVVDQMELNRLKKMKGRSAIKTMALNRNTMKGRRAFKTMALNRNTMKGRSPMKTMALNKNTMKGAGGFKMKAANTNMFKGAGRFKMKAANTNTFKGSPKAGPSAKCSAAAAKKKKKQMEEAAKKDTASKIKKMEKKIKKCAKAAKSACNKVGKIAAKGEESANLAKAQTEEAAKLRKLANAEKDEEKKKDLIKAAEKAEAQAKDADKQAEIAVKKASGCAKAKKKKPKKKPCLPVEHKTREIKPCPGKCKNVSWYRKQGSQHDWIHSINFLTKASLKDCQKKCLSDERCVGITRYRNGSHDNKCWGFFGGILKEGQTDFETYLLTCRNCDMKKKPLGQHRKVTFRMLKNTGWGGSKPIFTMSGSLKACATKCGLDHTCIAITLRGTACSGYSAGEKWSGKPGIKTILVIANKVIATNYTGKSKTKMSKPKKAR